MSFGTPSIIVGNEYFALISEGNSVGRAWEPLKVGVICHPSSIAALDHEFLGSMRAFVFVKFPKPKPTISKPKPPDFISSVLGIGPHSCLITINPDCYFSHFLYLRPSHYMSPKLIRGKRRSRLLRLFDKDFGLLLGIQTTVFSCVKLCIFTLLSRLW